MRGELIRRTSARGARRYSATLPSSIASFALARSARMVSASSKVGDVVPLRRPSRLGAPGSSVVEPESSSELRGVKGNKDRHKRNRPLDRRYNYHIHQLQRWCRKPEPPPSEKRKRARGSPMPRFRAPNVIDHHLHLKPAFCTRCAKAVGELNFCEDPGARSGPPWSCAAWIPGLGG